MNSKFLSGGIVTLLMMLTAMNAIATTDHPEYRNGWYDEGNHTYSFDVLLNETPSAELSEMMEWTFDITIKTDAADEHGDWYTRIWNGSGRGYADDDGISIRMNGILNSSYDLANGDLRDVIKKPRNEFNFTYSR